MNQESQIIQLKLLDGETRISEFSEKRSKQLARTYKRKVSMLEQRIDFKSEEDLDKAIALLAKDTAPAVADTFAVAGMASKVAADNALSWDGLYEGYKPARMSQNQLKGLALAEKVNGKTLTAHLDTAIGSQVRKEVSLARIRGEGIQKMTGDIWRSLGGAATRREVETVARTYTATASSYAKRLTYEQNSDVIKGYSWCATLENGSYKTGRGTCPRCAALDQREYKKLADVPAFPLHPNCRCFPTPITKSWREMGLDVPEMEKPNRPWTERLKSGKKEDYGTTDQSYGDWWKTKNKAWQDSSTVGPTRARMIREGLIKYEDIVDPKTGNLYTIKDLERRIGNKKQEGKKITDAESRRRAEAEEKKRAEAKRKAEAEAKKKAEEKKRKEAELKAKRKEEAEKEKKREELEKKRREESEKEKKRQREEAKRKEAEKEKKREEAEKKRREEEKKKEAERRKAELERKRREEAEAKKRRKEEAEKREAERKKKELEAKRKAELEKRKEEEEKRRKAEEKKKAEAEEKKRKETEEKEKKRKEELEKKKADEKKRKEEKAKVGYEKPTKEQLKKYSKKAKKEAEIIDKKIDVLRNKKASLEAKFGDLLQDGSSLEDEKVLSLINLIEKEDIKISDLLNKRKISISRGAAEFEEAIYSKESAGLSWSRSSNPRDIDNQALDKINRMVHPSAIKTPRDVDLKYIDEVGRAQYNTGTIEVFKNTNIATVIHEYGHDLDGGTYVRRRHGGTRPKVADFLERRTEGEAKTLIYGDEYGYKDKFFDHYVGKTYGTTKRNGNNEIISMGLQRMHEDPVGFYLEDEDYFSLILDMIWGDIDV